MLGRRWVGVPQAVRVIVGAELLVLCYGAAVHVVQLVVGQGQPYDWAPAWLAVYFTSLTVADPLAAWLLWNRRAAGLYAAAAVLVTDALANGYAVYALRLGSTAAYISHAIVSALAVAALATAPRVRPWLARRRTAGSD